MIEKLGLKSKLTFGKHKGDMIEGVIEDDPSYLEWAIDTIDWFELDEEAERELEKAVSLDDFSWADGYDLLN